MLKILRVLAIALVLLSVAGIASSPAEARTHHKRYHTTHHTHHRKSHHIVHHGRHHATTHGSAMVRTAQTHLKNLRYYHSTVDGVMGSRTILAVKHFQRDYHIRGTGKLTTPTYNAILDADMRKAEAVAELRNLPHAPPPPAASDFYKAHPDLYAYTAQLYAEPFQNTPVIVSGDDSNAHLRTIETRFAKIDVTEQPSDAGTHFYVATLNDAPLFTAEEQPSVIGISRAYNLRDEDAIIFSTYRQNNAACAYQYYLLTLRSDSNHLQEIGNCTRGYQAHTVNNTLIVVFPESEDGRAVGSTWRYDNGDLQRL